MRREPECHKCRISSVLDNLPMDARAERSCPGGGTSSTTGTSLPRLAHDVNAPRVGSSVTTECLRHSASLVSRLSVSSLGAENVRRARGRRDAGWTRQGAYTPPLLGPWLAVSPRVTRTAIFD